MQLRHIVVHATTQTHKNKYPFPYEIYHNSEFLIFKSLKTRAQNLILEQSSLLSVKLLCRSKPDLCGEKEQSAAHRSLEVCSRCWQREDLYQSCRWERAFAKKCLVSVWAGNYSFLQVIETCHKCNKSLGGKEPRQIHFFQR